MAKLNAPKRLIKEDFDEEYQGLIDKIAFSLNSFYDEVTNAFNKNINIDNLTREIITIDVENNSSGILKVPSQFKTNLTARIRGINIIKADNVSNPAIDPVEAPWISWTINTNIITVRKVTGIQADNKYQLTLEIIS